MDNRAENMNKSRFSILIFFLLISSGCISDSPPDLDDDGIPDLEDDDVDGDGWNNTLEVECNSDPENSESRPTDTDGDLTCDIIDDDDDDDTWEDFNEIECGSDPLVVYSVPDDLDDDKICDSLDDDADGDGLPNEWELERGFDPMDPGDYLSCHGKTVFCLRTYDNFTFPETHNAYSTIEDQVLLGVNHYTGLQKQWDNGIRAFMVDSHHRSYENTTQEDVRFCHSTAQFIHPCQFGEVDAFEWIGLLNSLMNNSSGDVVTLLIENYVPPEHLAFLFNQTGMMSRIYEHNLGDPWPSIGDMVLDGKDLVVFWEQAQNDEYPWLHDFGLFSWTTNYAENSKEEMSCTVHRGDGSQPVWHLNNWLSSIYGLPDPVAANEVNEYETLLSRSIECWEIMDNRPTFIAVDYWEQGEVTNVTITLNQMVHWSDEIPEHP